MQTKIFGLATAGMVLWLFALAAQAALISGTWTFSASAFSNPPATTDPVTGSFSFTNLDTTQDYTDSTGAGFSFSTNLDTSGAGGVGFDFDSAIQELDIGGLASGVNAGGIGDFILQIIPFTDPLSANADREFGYITNTNHNSVTVSLTPSIPEPATLALLGLGLAGLGFARSKQ